jgi:phospholipase/lecithinase/hemolysin
MWTRRSFLLLLLWLLAPVAARADYISGVVSFGDSLSDVGNVFQATGVPPAPYSNGRFSNGPIWLDQLSNRLGLSGPMPSSTGGMNYAWAGAETGAGTTPSFVAPGLQVPNVLTQVANFLTKHTLNPSQLVTIWAGGNDFLDGQTNPAVPLQNIAAAITSLAAAGGKMFLVPNLPNLANTPTGQQLSPAAQAGLAALSNGYNAGLAATLAQLQSQLNIKIYQPDVGSLFSSVQANPAKYGFTNVTTGAVNDKVYSGQGYLFWDSLHPTTAGHTLIGNLAADLLPANSSTQTPEPSSLALLGLGSVALLLRRKYGTKT